MTETKKAAFDAANIEGGGEKACAGTLWPGSVGYCITVPGSVASVLAAFSEPVTAAQLAAVLELPDVRAVTRLVQRERLHGAPICASCDAARAGFYLARSPEELERYLRALQGRIGATTATHTALLAVYDDWTGQQRLEGWEVL